MYNNYARGVLILIHKTIPFQLTNIVQDPQGRFVIAQGNILSIALNLASIYGPNEDKPTFFENFFLTLSSLHGLNIIGGDFLSISQALEARNKNQKWLNWRNK